MPQARHSVFHLRQYSSRVLFCSKAINLLAVATTPVIEEYGVNQIVKDLNALAITEVCTNDEVKSGNVT